MGDESVDDWVEPADAEVRRRAALELAVRASCTRAEFDGLGELDLGEALVTLAKIFAHYIATGGASR